MIVVVTVVGELVVHYKLAPGLVMVHFLLGIAFLAVLPLLAFLKTPEVKGPKVDLHLE